jgi:isopenicillin N synthase-like dioxygenase
VPAAPLPVIDVGPLVGGAGDLDGVARALDGACRGPGVFQVVGHGVDLALLAELDAAARAFFALAAAEKETWAMTRGGRAWRGWFPAGGELTAGVPDHKEGIYFGREEPPSDLPLHGPNLLPPGLGPLVLRWLAAMEALGHALVAGLALGLGLERTWFDRHLTADPTILFRIFRYPPVPAGAPGWGVGEHTDYGLLTILAQDATGGLEVRTPDGWVDVAPREGALTCNLGDMLERMTAGRYRATPHRVRPTAGPGDRLSFPFFFDPGWDAEVLPVPVDGPERVAPARWDGADPAAFSGTYGDYLTAKVAKVFPALAADL